MAKTRRRVLSILMALVLTLGLLPTAALAASGRDKNDPIVRFYVLDPNEGTPNNNNNGNKGSYYPKEGDDGGVFGATWKTGYPNGSLTLEGLQAFQSIGATGLFAANGINSAWYTEPDNLGDFSNKDIVWYSIKWQSSEGLHYCNIDGYVKDKTVNIFYYSNFNDQDECYYRTRGETGASHTVLAYDATMLPSRPGYEFTGWNTEKDGTGVSYNAAATFTITGPTDLYAQWEEIDYAPSEEPTATLTLNKEWAANVTAGDEVLLNLNDGKGTSVTPNLSKSSGLTNGKMTSGTPAILVFEGLTPDAEYQIIEDSTDYVLSKNSIDLSAVTVSGMAFPEKILDVTSCSDLTNSVVDLERCNYLVAALTDNTCVVWTYNPLDDDEKAAFVENCKTIGAYKLNVDTAHWLDRTNNSYGGVTVDGDKGTITFESTSLWRQFFGGIYTYLYDGTNNETTVTNSAKTGTLTISKTFSYDGSKTGAPKNFNAYFVVKDKNGNEKARLSYVDLSDSGKNPITLPYGEYTVTEENVVGDPGTAYNSSPVKTYKVGDQAVTEGFELKSSAMTVTVNNHYQYSDAPYLEIEKDANATVVVGETIEYIITVTNNGGSDATGVVVTDNLPEGLDLGTVELYDKSDKKITDEAVAKCENGTVIWNVGTLVKAGGTDSLTIKVQVEEETELTSITNWASVTYASAPEGYEKKDDATTTITRSNLSVAKTAVTYSTYDAADPTANVVSADGSTAQPGDTIVYTITVTNSGTAAASGVSVTDELPDSGYTFVSATGDKEPSDGKITWTGLTVAANGGKVEKQVIVTVNDLANPSQGITLTNTAVLGEQESPVTTTVGATKGTLTISKTISGVPAVDTAAWNVLSGLTFTVQKQVEMGDPEQGSGQPSYTWVDVDGLINIAITRFDSFENKSGTYTFDCGNVEPGTYRVVEAGGYDLSAYGYTRDEEDATASDAVPVSAGAPATASIVNNYTGKTYTIIFDAGQYGKVDGRTGTWTWTWTEYKPAEAAAYYDWAGLETTGTGSKVVFTFTQDQYLTFDLEVPSDWIDLKDVVSGATAKTGTPVEGGVANGKYYFNNGAIFTSIADAYAAMNAANETSITYTADYTFTYTFTDYGSSNVEMAYWVAGQEGNAPTAVTAFNTKVTEQAGLDSTSAYQPTIFFVKAKSGYQINETSSLKCYEGTKSGTEQTWELIELDEDTVAPDGMTADTWAAVRAAALEAGYTHCFGYVDNDVFNHWFKVTATKDPVVALGGTKIVALGGNTAPGEQIFTFKLERFVRNAEEEGPVTNAVNRMADVPGFTMVDTKSEYVTTNGAGEYRYAFDEITYTEEGYYFYRIYEEIPESASSYWTYDQSVYYITVHVYEKDTTGQLVAEVLYQKAATPDAEIGEAADAVIFTNTYTRNTSTGPIDPGPVNPGPGTIIPDEGTPTTDLPEEETPTTELPEEETPMTELPEEEVPMAEVPATGDTAGLWALAAGVSGLALVWLALSGKKRREENA